MLHDVGEKVLVGFARDITERRRAERELARLTRQQKHILDSTAEGIVGLDRNGTITFINPGAARMLGYKHCELIGRAADEVFFGTSSSTENGVAGESPLDTVLRDGEAAVHSESIFTRIDGVSFPVEYSVTAMWEETQVIGAVLVFKDVTEQRRAEEERRSLEMQIQQGQKLESLGLLAGGIAHDLNNMLAGIQGNACLALAELPIDHGVHGRLDRIVGVCERASKVIQQILAYAGHVSCEASPVQLNDLVADMKEFMRVAVPDMISLETDLSPDLPLVEADSGQLQQVITSLLVNAVEAIGEQAGRITLSTSMVELGEEELSRRYPRKDLKPGRYVRLSIADDGCGMSAETAARIFDPFFSKKGAGRGLGLSAIHGVIGVHHGGLRVESECGRGTRFTIILPAAPRRAAPAVKHKTRAQMRSGSTLLVIDDDDEVRDVIRDMLTYRGLRVLTAEDGASGIELFREHVNEIDVVLLDMMMPGMSGDEVLPKLLDIRPDATVIVSSGFGEEGVASRFGEVKPAGFVHKPFTPDVLIERISGVLERQGNGDSAGGARACGCDAAQTDGERSHL